MPTFQDFIKAIYPKRHKDIKIFLSWLGDGKPYFDCCKWLSDKDKEEERKRTFTKFASKLRRWGIIRVENRFVKKTPLVFRQALVGVYEGFNEQVKGEKEPTGEELMNLSWKEAKRRLVPRSEGVEL